MNAPELLASDPSAFASPFLATGDFDHLDVIAAARTAGCVLFTGPANAKAMALRIHNLSGWRWGSFVSVDCGASQSVLERQLFSALRVRQESDWDGEPRPELLQDGTIFLYEVGKLSLALQARLADALGDVPRDPQRRSRKRVMASSSVPLLERVLAGTFDERLFYRLNAIHFMMRGRLGAG
jgi:DNA-binding NtrC family response regulator